MNTQVIIQPFFHEASNTISYLVADPATHQAAIIDPVMDYFPADGKVSFSFADLQLNAAKKENFEIIWILETHAHADHLSAAQYIKAKTQAKIGIGQHICEVQKIFSKLFNFNDISLEGKEFDHLFHDGEVFKLGQLEISVLHTPGHTPACITYHVADAAFVGDTLFMPDYGTARADFPGGNAHTLYQSIQRILALPQETRLFMCHDYKSPIRNCYAWETTVHEQRQHNVHIHQGISENEYVKNRQVTDAQLSAPKLLLPSVQVNIRAGHFPPAESNGTHYLKIPLTVRPPQ